MKEISNRSALYVIPKEPFKKWATFYNELSKEELDDRLKEKHIFMIDSFYKEDLKDILKPYYKKIFEYELMSWNNLKHEWPEDRSIDAFLDWFEVIFCDGLFDLKSGKIEIDQV